MIRKAQEADYVTLGQLWLRAILPTHDFIGEQYWVGRVESIIRDFISRGDTYVYEENSVIMGFLTSRRRNFVEGLFVDTPYQGRGIGSQLLSFAQKRLKTLEVDVYAKNTIGIAFYRKHNFRDFFVHRGPQTGEDILRLRWRR